MSELENEATLLAKCLIEKEVGRVPHTCREVTITDVFRKLDEFQKKSLLYSRNLASKFHYLSQAVTNIRTRLDVIESKIAEVSSVTSKLGKAAGEAFAQTKQVIEHLHQEQSHTREELSMYGGHLIEDSWDTGTRTRVV